MKYDEGKAASPTWIVSEMFMADKDCSVECLISLCNLIVAQETGFQRERRSNGMWVIWSDKVTGTCIKTDNEFSEFFYVRQNGRNEFLEPKLFPDFGFLHLGLLISGGLSLSNTTPYEYTLSIGTIGLGKLYCLCTEYRKFCRFLAPGLALTTSG